MISKIKKLLVGTLLFGLSATAYAGFSCTSERENICHTCTDAFEVAEWTYAWTSTGVNEMAVNSQSPWIASYSCNVLSDAPTVVISNAVYANPFALMSAGIAMVECPEGYNV